MTSTQLKFLAIFGILLILATLPACTTSKNAKAGRRDSVRMHLCGDLPLVKVELAGKSRTFLVDTGATHTVVTPKLARKLDLRVARAAFARSATGAPTRVGRTTIGQMKVGATRFDQVPAIICDLSAVKGLGEPIEGILGFSAFRDHLVTLDFPGENLRIEPWRPLTGDRAVPVEMKNGTPHVALRNARGQSAAALIDSGAMKSIEINPAKLAVKISSPIRIEGICHTINESYPVRKAHVEDTLSFGGVALINPKVEIGTRGVRIGAQALKNLQVTFDQRTNRVVFSPVAEAW